MHIHWRPSLRSMPRQAEAVSPPSQSLASTATAKRFRTPAKSAARSTDIPVGIWQRAHRADRNIGPPTVLSGGGQSVALVGFGRAFDVGSWKPDVGWSVFPISILNTTALSRLPRAGLGAPWYHPGHTPVP